MYTYIRRWNKYEIFKDGQLVENLDPRKDPQVRIKQLELEEIRRMIKGGRKK